MQNKVHKWKMYILVHKFKIIINQTQLYISSQKYNSGEEHKTLMVV